MTLEKSQPSPNIKTRAYSMKKASTQVQPTNKNEQKTNKIAKPPTSVKTPTGNSEKKTKSCKY